VTVPHTPAVLKRPRSSRCQPPRSQKELEEETAAYIATHQFKARPMPDLSYKPPHLSSPNSPHPRLKPTITRPFRLSLESRVSVPVLPPASADELELAKQFKARSMPIFAKTSPLPNISSSKTSAIRSHDAGDSSKPRVISVPREPRLSTGTQTERRQDISVAARQKDVVSKSKEKKCDAVEKQRRERDGIASSSAASRSSNAASRSGPTIPQPFHLESELRGDIYQEQLQERIRQEEMNRSELARCIKAKPAPRFSTPFTPQHSGVELTEPLGFSLKTDIRHEQHQAELESKLQAVETRLSMESRVKPLPVPKTLYKAGFRPVVPSELGREPIRGSAPLLNTDVQSKRRQSFDQEMTERREKERKIKALMQEEEKREIDREIYELRRLPASEGGFIPVALPLNAALHQRRISSGGSRDGHMSPARRLMSFR